MEFESEEHANEAVKDNGLILLGNFILYFIELFIFISATILYQFFDENLLVILTRF